MQATDTCSSQHGISNHQDLLRMLGSFRLALGQLFLLPSAPHHEAVLQWPMIQRMGTWFCLAVSQHSVYPTRRGSFRQISGPILQRVPVRLLAPLLVWPMMLPMVM